MTRDQALAHARELAAQMVSVWDTVDTTVAIETNDHGVWVVDSDGVVQATFDIEQDARGQDIWAVHETDPVNGYSWIHPTPDTCFEA